MSDTSIPEPALGAFVDALDKANVRVARLFPGDSPRRQPVHVVYGGAHLFKADAAQKLGEHGEGAEVLLMGENNHVRPEWVYGRDPYPPRLTGF